VTGCVGKTSLPALSSRAERILRRMLLCFHGGFFFFYSSAIHRDLHSFPTRRSSDLLSRDACARRRARAAQVGHVLSRQPGAGIRSEEHTSELQSPYDLVCRLLLEKKNHHGLLHRVQHRLQVEVSRYVPQLPPLPAPE